MGGIDPFGDIMGTSAGPGKGGEKKIYLFNRAACAHLHLSVDSSTVTQSGTQTWPHSEGEGETDVSQFILQHSLFQ